MKKLIIAALLITGLHAYNIGGEYATLESCEWTSYGYQHGYVGTYRTSTGSYKIFFGSRYCEY